MPSSRIRLLGFDRHRYLAGTEPSMAPGMGTPEELAPGKADPHYRAAARQNQSQGPRSW